MKYVAYGIPWMPVSLIEAFLKTKWRFLDYSVHNMEFSSAIKYNPEVLISFSPPEEIRSHASVKFILTPGAGIDQMPLQAIREQGQTIINCHANASSVAEHAWGLLLTSARKLTKYDKMVRDQEKWPDQTQIKDLNVDLAGKTIGIIGYGSIGQKLDRYAHAFEMDTIIFRKHPQEYQFSLSDLEDQLDNLDFIILAVPLTDETKAIISRELINHLPSHIIIINVARGELIEEDALFDALREGLIRGAGLDVWENSPHRSIHGLRPEEFIHVPNLVISPHRAWISKDSFGKVAQQLALELDNIAKKRGSTNKVDLDLGY